MDFIWMMIQVGAVGLVLAVIWQIVDGSGRKRRR